MTQTRIALIGHCRADQFALRSALGSMFPDAEYVMVGESADVQEEASSVDLCLVNRELDGQFTEADGIELIRGLFSTSKPTSAVLLVSNYSQAQEQAVQAGAHLGFGKQDLNTDEMRDSISSALAARTDDTMQSQEETGS